ncbi:ABC transporter permease [Kineosporia succinea]|uniref:Uncharacterized protein n=1 Tax=Kineosporia succinea TaxID=84632 RepID=A0ABT9P190_9ACTN|nr:hypothetical protein [Kineosporia succinea]MDP9826431.1 hypothetical protein [Kineosporia succinea]
MTRDSASGKGPETDSEKDVTDAPEAATKSTTENAVSTSAPTGTQDSSPAGESSTETTVAVDTTDDEPSETQDTTDEGVVSAAGDTADATGTTSADTTDSPASATASGNNSDTNADAVPTAGATKPIGTSKPEAADLTLKPLPTSAAKADSSDSSDSTATSGAGASDDKTDDTADDTAAATTVAAPVAAAAVTTPSANSSSTPSSSPATSTSAGTGTATSTSTGTGTGTGTGTATGTGAASAADATSAQAAGDVDATTASPVGEPPATGGWGVQEPKQPRTPRADGKYDTLFPLIGTLVALAAIAALLIGAMTLPIAKSKPHEVPVGVGGAAEITGQLTTLLEQFGGEGTFDVRVYTTQDDLRSGIEDREVYGGLYVDDTQAQMMIASAAGIQASDALQTVANTLMQQAGAQVTVVDVVAQPLGDPRGDGLAAAELPLVILSVLPAIALALLYRRRPLAQIGGAVLASAALGLAIAAVLNFVTKSTAGTDATQYWLLSAGLAAGVLTTSIVLLGLHALLGRWGLGIGAAILVLFGAPLSGLSSVPEWLPTPWGTVGQLMPPGATATVLRSMAFFDGQGSKSALLVFVIYTVVGAALLLLGSLLRNNNDRLAEIQAEQQALELEQAEEKTAAAV